MYLIRTLFGLCLLVLPAAYVFSFVLTSPTAVTQLVSNSNAYPTLTQTIVNTAVSSFDSSGQTYGLGKTAVTNAAVKAFPESDIEHKGNTTITNAYAWFEGKVPTFQPSLDFSSNQKVFAQALSSQVLQTISAKPVCSHTQLYQLTPSAADPATILQLPCEPSDLDLGYLQTVFAGAAPDVQLNLNLDQSSGSGLPSVTSASNKPAATSSPQLKPQFLFGTLKNSFFIVLGASVILLLVIIALIRRPRQCVLAIAKPFIVDGILVLLYAWLAGQALSHDFFSNLLSKSQGGDVVQALTQPFLNLVINNGVYFGTAFCVVGGMLLIIYIVTKPKPSVASPTVEVKSEAPNDSPLPSATKPPN